MGLHMPELIIVLVVALLIFGPKKLPEMGSAIGRSVQAFRKGVNGLANSKDDESSNPGDADRSDPATQEALPPSRQDSSSQANASSTSEEIRAEKHAD